MSAELVRFHREIYAGEAVDEAVKLFESHATFELRETESHWEVSIEAREGDKAHGRALRGEFENYVLGLTVQRGGPS